MPAGAAPGTPIACLALRAGAAARLIAAGMFDPTMLDLDVAAILAGFLRGAAPAARSLRTSAAARGASRTVRRLADRAARRRLRAATTLVDAAGAWADRWPRSQAWHPLGIVPQRRTAIIVQAPTGCRSRRWPMIERRRRGAGTSSPTPAGCSARPPTRLLRAPCDAQPEELDVADLRRSDRGGVRPPDQADRKPLGGPAQLRPRPDARRRLRPSRTEGFVWLAGQGGYGIQTAPALAALSAAIIWAKPAGRQRVPTSTRAATPARLLSLAGYAGQSSASG